MSPLPDEITTLLDVATRLEAASVDYMLTGSMALNVYAMPRMTRDIDLVAAVVLKDADRIESIFPGEEYYVSSDAVREAVSQASSFNLIHLRTMNKLDIMIRKREEYRLNEFDRRTKIEVRGQGIWVVTIEDLILSKMDWARDSRSERQMEDVKNLLAAGCDMAYVESWAERLGLTGILTQVMG